MNTQDVLSLRGAILEALENGNTACKMAERFFTEKAPRTPQEQNEWQILLSEIDSGIGHWDMLQKLAYSEKDNETFHIAEIIRTVCSVTERITAVRVAEEELLRLLSGADRHYQKEAALLAGLSALADALARRTAQLQKLYDRRADFFHSVPEQLSLFGSSVPEDSENAAKVDLQENYDFCHIYRFLQEAFSCYLLFSPESRTERFFRTICTSMERFAAGETCEAFSFSFTLEEENEVRRLDIHESASTLTLENTEYLSGGQPAHWSFTLRQDGSSEGNLLLDFVEIGEFIFRNAVLSIRLPQEFATENMPSGGRP